MRSITVPNSLGDILSHEDRVKVNTSPAYDDDVMNVMLLSGNVENGPALATPKSSKKKTYAGIARKVPVPVASATNNEACEEEVVRRHPVLPAPNIATPSPRPAKLLKLHRYRNIEGKMHPNFSCFGTCLEFSKLHFRSAFL